MTTATILTPWTGDGLSTSTAYCPLVVDNYPLAAWTDVTSQPAENIIPLVNLVQISVELDRETLGAIEADDRFEVLYVEE